MPPVRDVGCAIIEQWDAMKRPNRPFVVEIKQSRRGSKRPQHSIWSNVDLTAFNVNGDDAEPRSVSQPDRSATNGRALHRFEPPTAARILPALAASSALEESEDVAIGAVGSTPNDAGSHEEGMAVSPETPAGRMRRSRLRRSLEKPLPAGQRWKRRLPKILR